MLLFGRLWNCISWNSVFVRLCDSFFFFLLWTVLTFYICSGPWLNSLMFKCFFVHSVNVKVMTDRDNRERINLDIQIINPSKCTNIIIDFYCSSTILQHIYSFEESNSMEQNPPWDANSSCASQEIPLILWNPKVYSMFKSLCNLSISSVR